MRVLVVGGGVSGLVAARELVTGGHEVTLVEREQALGGTIRATELAGVRVDVGAESFSVVRPEAAELVEELGLSPAVVSPARSDARLWSDAGLAVLPASLLGIPSDLSDPDLESIVGAEALHRAAELDALPAEALPADITLGAVVRGRLGDPIVERVLAPVVAGVHALHPDLLECEAVVPGLLEALTREGSLTAAVRALRSRSSRPGAGVAGLRGGMTVLIDALSQQVGDARIITGTRVARVRSSGGTWRVELDERGNSRELDADSVVLAIAAPAASTLLPPGTAAASALAALPVGEVAVASIVVDAAVLDEHPVGSGVLVVPGEGGVAAKAMTHVTAKWEWAAQAYGPGRHLLRLSYGRDGRLDVPLDSLIEQAQRDASRITRVALDAPIDAAVTRWPDSLVQARPGHRERVRAVTASTAHTPGLAVVGAGLGGNGIAGAVREARTVLDLLT